MRATRSQQLPLLQRPSWTYPSIGFLLRLRVAQVLHLAAEGLADIACRIVPAWTRGMP
jgi:hypothetical protein